MTFDDVSQMKKQFYGGPEYDWNASLETENEVENRFIIDNYVAIGEKLLMDISQMEFFMSCLIDGLIGQ